MPDDMENREEVTSVEEDPFDLKKATSGILVLVVVCSILWALSKFGPTGANWISSQTQQLLGIDSGTPVEVDIPKPSEPIVAEPPEPPVLSTPQPVPVPEKGKVTGNPKIDNARRQLIEALGGPEKALVKHIAISEDEKSMVAAVRFLQDDKPDEMLEIYFDKDNFGRYISAPDAPVDQEIKIWNEP
jgi:hypothetical protein